MKSIQIPKQTATVRYTCTVPFPSHSYGNESKVTCLHMNTISLSDQWYHWPVFQWILIIRRWTAVVPSDTQQIILNITIHYTVWYSADSPEYHHMLHSVIFIR